ncbi:MAG: hypothetical protein JNK60_21825, partial [Acidobacteria bacterium]|nr:hypothetical protein [Acidobacteriota bacterium]
VTATTVTSDSSQMISGSSSAATTIQTYGTSSFGGEDFISVSRIEVRSSVPVLGTLTVVNVFSTPFLSGPKEICGGKVYNLPATPGTQTTTPPGVSSASTALARKLEILSANEQVTVPAGTFATYHTKATASDGTITEVWTDRPTGLIAKQISTGTNGTTTYQATSLR